MEPHTWQQRKQPSDAGTHRSPSPWLASCALITALIGCADRENIVDDSAGGGTARFSVTVQGLTSSSGVEIEVPPGSYTLEATGRVEMGVASIDIQARDYGGHLAAGAVLKVEGSRVGASDGDVGAGSAPATAAPGRVTSVTLPFVWQGRGESSGWNIGLDFQRGPTISSWTVSPAPEVPAESNLELRVVAGAAPPGSLRVVATLDAAAPAPLVLDAGAGAFVGTLTAPSAEGVHHLVVSASDAQGRTTSVGKDLLVVPAQIPHPVDDLAGLLVPAVHRLWVMPAHEQAVLRALGATPIGSGLYLANDPQTGAPVTFGTTPVEQPATAQPDLVSQDQNTKVYKNAECKLAEKGFLGPCYPSSPPPGSSTRNEWFNVSKCVRGSAYCVERHAVIGIRHNYDLADCTVEVSNSNYEGFVCK